ncbi:30S ribosomal protein S11 [Patescibacteria group bacterium]|nr:30S ribosomal protein S11 [Patescibacteria group bacterium]MBU1672833.1 30S ribosomal protein S11 [Patescibacteria group bacterium]MBU1963269.1 30S ribosomal protein S11 [Patescibacteria group bacterium]
MPEENLSAGADKAKEEKTEKIEETKKSDSPAGADKAKEGPKGEDKVEVKKKKGKKGKKVVTKGRVYIMATYNNTIVSYTDENGNLLNQSSAGHHGFKGPKKATPYAAGVIVKESCEVVKSYGLKDIDVFIKGIGSGRDGALRALNAAGFNINSIKDRTPIPHNGCRPKKQRRV